MWKPRVRSVRLLVVLAVAVWLAGHPGCSCRKLPEAPRAPASLLDEGDLALANHDPKAAGRYFDQALALEPDNPRALLGKARSLKDLGDGATALETFTHYANVETEPWTPRALADYCAALALAAEQSIERDDPEQGLRLGLRLPRSDCHEPGQRELVMRAQLGLAAQEREAGRKARALKRYRRVLDEDSQTKSGTSKRAPARSPDPGPQDRLQAEAYRGAAELLLEAGDRRQALELLSEGVGRFPRDKELLELMVGVLADSDS